MRRFADPAHSHEYPLCSQLMREFPERELLYLACIFHDIAKGRGGDHSELGMADARDYCTQLGLTEAQVELVAWLVEHHLTMSAFAQKRDIADPAVVEEFAALVGTESACLRSTCSPLRMFAAPARKYGTTGRLDCWNNCSGQPARCSTRRATHLCLMCWLTG